MTKNLLKLLFYFSNSINLTICSIAIMSLIHPTRARITQSYYDSYGSLIVTFDYRKHRNKNTFRQSIMQWYENQLKSKYSNRIFSYPLTNISHTDVAFAENSLKLKNPLKYSLLSYLYIIFQDCDTYTNQQGKGGLWSSFTGEKEETMNKCSKEISFIQDDMNQILALLEQSKRINTGYDGDNIPFYITEPLTIQDNRNTLAYIREEIKIERNQQSHIMQTRNQLYSLPDKVKLLKKGVEWLQQYLLNHPNTSLEEVILHIRNELESMQNNDNYFETLLVYLEITKQELIAQNDIALNQIIELYSTPGDFARLLHEYNLILDEKESLSKKKVNQLQYQELLLTENIQVSQNRFSARQTALSHLAQKLKVRNPEQWSRLPVLKLCYNIHIVSDKDSNSGDWICQN